MFKPHYLHIFTKHFRRTLAIFEDCLFLRTSSAVQYSVFLRYLQCGKLLQTDQSVIGWFEAFSEVFLGTI